MRTTTVFFYALVCTLLLAACSGKQEVKLIGYTPEDMPSLNVKDGEQKSYFKNGTVEYVIPTVGSKAEGLVKRYYDNGVLYSETEYKNGQKNGKCTTYFKNGKLFSVGNFVNGQKDGKETKYYQDGKVSTECEYKEGKLQPGIKEYNQNGSIITNQVAINVKPVDKRATEKKYYLEVTVSDQSLLPYFYITGLTSSNERVKLKMMGAKGIAEFNMSPGSYVNRKLLIEAEYKSKFGNTLTAQRTYNLMIK